MMYPPNMLAAAIAALLLIDSKSSICMHVSCPSPAIFMNEVEHYHGPKREILGLIPMFSCDGITKKLSQGTKIFLEYLTSRRHSKACASTIPIH